MRQRTERHQEAADRTVKDIRRKTRKRYSSEEKIRIVLAGDTAREANIGRFVSHYDYDRYHESLSNLTPAGVYLDVAKLF